MFLETLNIVSNKIAHKPAKTVIKATVLSSLKGLLKSIWVRLKMIKPKAIMLNIYVKILILKLGLLCLQ